MFELFKNKNTKRGGYTFTPERQAELKEKREFLLGEYDCSNCLNTWKKTKKRVIRVVDGFSDIGEVLAFYKVKPENCVAILGHKGKYSGDLNEIPKFPNDIAGVFCIHEKKREVSFLNGIGENTVLYNVDVTYKDAKYYADKRNHLFSNMPTKEQITKVLFGKEQRVTNQEIIAHLASQKVLGTSHLYFYMTTKAAKVVRDKVFSFKDEFFSIKANSFMEGKYYPRVPDEVRGGVFDWDQVEIDAKEGVKTSFLEGYKIYEKLSETNLGLKEILEMEKLRIDFINQFPDLEEQLFSNAYSNEFGRLGIYSYSSYDRASYGGNSDFEVRGIKDKHRSVWSDIIYELEDIYNDKLPKIYSGHSDKKDKEEKITRSFYKICNEMVRGKASGDLDIISYINMRSPKLIKEQLERGTTFSFVDMPIIETQNYNLKGNLYKSVHDFFKNVADEELEKEFIKSTVYETI